MTLVGRVLAPRDLIIVLPPRERERGRTLGKVNTFNQDRTFGVPTFPPRSFNCRLLFPILLSRPEIQIAESVLGVKVIEDNFDRCFIHDVVLRRFYVT